MVLISASNYIAISSGANEISSEGRLVKGSWGWGGNSRITEERVNEYYKKYEQQGGIIINPAIGKNEPHQNLTVYKTIGNKLDSILK